MLRTIGVLGTFQKRNQAAIENREEGEDHRRAQRFLADVKRFSVYAKARSGVDFTRKNSMSQNLSILAATIARNERTVLMLADAVRKHREDLIAEDIEPSDMDLELWAILETAVSDLPARTAGEVAGMIRAIGEEGGHAGNEY